jgi:hypothetical protein
LTTDRQPSWSIDPVKIYTLTELIDLAEFPSFFPLRLDRDRLL